MEKTLMLVCPFSNSQSFLISRFPSKAIRFMTAISGIFHFNDRIFANMLGNFLITENIKTIYLVQDLHSKFLMEGINETLLNPNEAITYIAEVFDRHQVEISAESSLSQRLSKLSLFLIEAQVAEMRNQPNLQRVIQENKIQIKGMLTNEVRAKSIEFYLQPEFQVS